MSFVYVCVFMERMNVEIESDTDIGKSKHLEIENMQILVQREQEESGVGGWGEGEDNKTRYRSFLTQFLLFVCICCLNHAKYICTCDLRVVYTLPVPHCGFNQLLICVCVGGWVCLWIVHFPPGLITLHGNTIVW